MSNKPKSRWEELPEERRKEIDQGIVDATTLAEKLFGFGIFDTMGKDPRVLTTALGIALGYTVASLRISVEDVVPIVEAGRNRAEKFFKQDAIDKEKMAKA